MRRTGQPREESDFKITLQTPDRRGSFEERHFDFIFQPTFYRAGTCEGIFVLALERSQPDSQREARTSEQQEAGKEDDQPRPTQGGPQHGTWEWDPAEEAHAFSEEMHQLFGTNSHLSNDDVYATCVSRVYPADLSYLSKVMEDCHRFGAIDAEFRYSHPSMGLRRYRARGWRMEGTTRFFGALSDVTEHEDELESLSEREQELRSLAKALPHPVWLAKPDGFIHWFNEKWYDFTGTTAEENRGWGWKAVVEPEAWTEVEEQWNASLRSGDTFEIVFALKGKAGTYKRFLTRAVPIRSESGVITRWFGTHTDARPEFATERQKEPSRAEMQAAAEATQRLAAIVESSDDAIISKDLNGVVKSWNPGAERVFGYTAAEMIGESIHKIIPPELLPDENRIMAAVARGERTEHFEAVRLRKDGEQIEVSLNLSPIFDAKGNVTGVASISRDVSQQRRVERALHTSERLATVGRLAATIAHEINNPLEAVTNLVYLAQTSMEDKDGKVFLEQAQQELARMALLTKQTLGFYRETRGARPLTMGELVTPLVAVFSARARNKQISINTEIRENPTMVGYPGELRQLFANLLNNSIDAVRDHGRILIRVSAGSESSGQKRQGIRLTVCDNGPGIPTEVRKKLFEPFFTTKRDVGTGLGLWVTSTILRKHEGTMRVRSNVTAGKSWTVFSVFFPLRSASAVAAN